jgi:hypothetical protein
MNLTRRANWRHARLPETHTDRVSEVTRRGVTPASALLALLEDLSVRQLELLIEELEGSPTTRPEEGDETPESMRNSAIAAGFSPEGAEVFVRHSEQLALTPEYVV